MIRRSCQPWTASPEPNCLGECKDSRIAGQDAHFIAYQPINSSDGIDWFYFEDNRRKK
jgi:hypothetical protein